MGEEICVKTYEKCSFSMAIWCKVAVWEDDHREAEGVRPGVEENFLGWRRIRGRDPGVEENRAGLVESQRGHGR